jgi:DNA polymerase-3 subunit delta
LPPLELAVAEGATPVGLLRAAIGHLQRLHRIRLHMADGLSAPDAARMARPPIFFRRMPAFTRALGLWSPGALQAALQGLADAERACKRTGTPDVVLSRNAILALARRAAQVRGANRT